MTNPPALIVGGGVAGLALSIGLARGGVSSRVLEASLDPRPVGAGLQLGPNAARALTTLGLDAARIPGIVSPQALTIDDGAGRILARRPLKPDFEARYGAPYRAAHRGDLWTYLRDEALSVGVAVETGLRVEGIGRGARGLGVRCADRVFEGACLVGADGLRSAVRDALAFEHAAEPPSAPPTLRDHGLEAWRTLIPAERVPGLADEVRLTLGPKGGHGVHYPVRGGAMINVVLVLPAMNATSNEEAAEYGADPRPLPRTAVDAVRSGPLRSLMAAADHWTRWRLRDRDPGPHWGQRAHVIEGLVTLIGDAAHPALPFLAQGGAMALEDAAALAAPLARAIREGGDVDETLRAFERARHARTRRLVEASRSAGRIYHLTGLAATARNAAIGLAGARSTDRYGWIYEG